MWREFHRIRLRGAHDPAHSKISPLQHAWRKLAAFQCDALQYARNSGHTEFANRGSWIASHGWHLMQRPSVANRTHACVDPTTQLKYLRWCTSQSRYRTQLAYHPATLHYPKFLYGLHASRYVQSLDCRLDLFQSRYVMPELQSHIPEPSAHHRTNS